MLFSCSDGKEVDRLRLNLSGAGIPCEVRRKPPISERADIAFFPELWIHNDADFRVALMLLASARRLSRGQN